VKYLILRVFHGEKDTTGNLKGKVSSSLIAFLISLIKSFAFLGSLASFAI
jgi:hypothetical protein